MLWVIVHTNDQYKIPCNSCYSWRSHVLGYLWSCEIRWNEGKKVFFQRPPQQCEFWYFDVRHSKLISKSSSAPQSISFAKSAWTNEIASPEAQSSAPSHRHPIQMKMCKVHNAHGSFCQQTHSLSPSLPQFFVSSSSSIFFISPSTDWDHYVLMK